MKSFNLEKNTQELTPLESWKLWLSRRIPRGKIWQETALEEVYKEGYEAGRRSGVLQRGNVNPEFLKTIDKINDILNKKNDGK